MIKEINGKLVRRFDAETLWIEPWGENSLRVRATAEASMPLEDWALLPASEADSVITMDEHGATIRNGCLSAVLSNSGKLSFYRNGELLLEEFIRDMDQAFTSHMRIRGRELKGNVGGCFQATVRFESDPDEKLYGMGQYQQGIFNLKGATLELMQRNSQASVPFVLSNKGYGMLWHNPAIGSVTFGTNMTVWHAQSTHLIDYWMTAGDCPAQIVRQYVRATGLPPMMPESAMGLWQSKLRYRNQEELLNVAREYHRRGLPLGVIVVDFYHWKHFGDWDFDESQWPDPAAMIGELKEMGVDVSVSVWPVISPDSENFGEMYANGYLTQADMGVRVAMRCKEWIMFLDATNPEARAYLWEKLKKNYFRYGVRYFWMDAVEPQYASFLNYGAEGYRYQKGPHLMIGNMYPQLTTRAIYEGMRENGVEKTLVLTRCAWAGSQRYGALVWSGDIHASFKSMRWQLVAGMQMGLAGIPWWTTDIGGFDCGNIEDPAFRELLVRWFQWSVFSPVLRMHGDRQPRQLYVESGLTDYSGAPNELWSYGEENFQILKKFLLLRQQMRPYLHRLMQEAHEQGDPVMRPLFYHFPQDEQAWEIKDSYLFGADVLVAPVVEAGSRSRNVYLPRGTNWIDWNSRKVYEGAQWIMADTPLETIPVFVREGACVSGLL